MATTPPAEAPPPSVPDSPTSPGPEIAPPGRDIDQPSPGTPSTPTEAPASPVDDRRDPRSDLQQVVEARSDAVARGEGGCEPETFTAPGLEDGVGGTGGVVKNQDDTAQ